MAIACQDVDVWPPFHVSVDPERCGESDIFVEVYEIFFIVSVLSEEPVKVLLLEFFFVVFDVFYCVAILGIIKKLLILLFFEFFLSFRVFELVGEILLYKHRHHQIDDVRIELEPHYLLLVFFELYVLSVMEWVDVVAETYEVKVLV